MWQAARSPVICWRVTVASSGLALVAAQLLGPFFEPLSFLAFLAAVSVSAWYGGLWPGLLATAFSLAGSAYLLLGVRASRHDDVGAAIGLAGFLLVALLISVLMARLHAKGRPAAAEAGRAEWSLQGWAAPAVAQGRADDCRESAVIRPAVATVGREAARTTGIAARSAAPVSGIDLTELEALAELAVPRLADWCAIDVIQADGASHRLVVAPAVSDELARLLRQRFPCSPAKLGCPLREVRGDSAGTDPSSGMAGHAAVRALLEELGLASALVLPLVKDGRSMGSLALVSAETDRCASAERRILAAEVAARAAVLLENLRLRGDLKESQAYLGGIMAATTDALLVIDSDGRFVDANSAASTLFGTPRATLARMGIGDLPVLGPTWTAEERTRFVREGVWKGRMDLRRSDGGATLVDVRVSAVVLPDDTIYVAALRLAVDGRSLPLAGSLSASSAIRRPR